MGMQSTERKRLAVVGGGISGLSSAWLLSKQHDVVLYEREARLGGHSNTVDVETSDGIIAVDTGFIVFNEWTYSNLVALFDYLNVPTLATDMSFGVSADNGGFEYSGGTLSGLIGQYSNVFRPRFWRMLREINKFYSNAPEMLVSGELDDKTLGQILDNGRYSDAFQRDHLLPMAAAIWSGTVEGMRDYPAASFARFFVNHGLFNFTDRPQWHTVQGGSRVYVEKISQNFESRSGAGVRCINRNANGVEITDNKGHVDTFDRVIMASHANDALAMLSDADDMERKLLSPFKYQKNLAVLHNDVKLMPKRRRVWSSWNYLARPGQNADRSQDLSVCVTYWMNNLQHIDERHPLFVTLNPMQDADPSRIFQTFEYEHPLFDNKTDAAQQELWQLQGHRSTWYCGSYFGAGFHEDGLQSGLWAAESAGGVRRPWSVENESGRIYLGPNQAEAA
jgi:predicted NAD/FAD-binding protein